MSRHFTDIDRPYEVVWEALPGSQKLFLSCPIFEVLYSGTRGPGKTDTLLMDFLQDVGKGWGSEWRGVIFRTQFRDLNDIVQKSLKWFPRIIRGAKFNWAKYEWIFPDGESLLFRHIKKPSDYQAYHGHAYPFIGFEELTNWPDDVVYKLMMSCCRSTVVGMPRKFRATTNPYGVGFNWVKARFRLPTMAHKVIRDKGKPERVAILGYLQENVHLLAAEPDYPDRIREAARNHSELMAWLFGSWDITAGGMFDDLWDRTVHVVEPFDIPHTWRIDRSFDWGSSSPFSVQWWAESDGCDVETPRGHRSTIRGDLFLIYEWYGWRKNQPNVGLRMLGSDIAKGIIEREKLWGIHDRVVPGPADNQVFDEENGNCVAADMEAEGVEWERSDKSAGSRKQGWEQMRKRLQHSKRKRGEPREYPGLFVFKGRGEQFERTVPSLPRCDKDPDDVDTEAEDHAGDSARYRARYDPGMTAGVW